MDLEYRFLLICFGWIAKGSMFLQGSSGVVQSLS